MSEQKLIHVKPTRNMVFEPDRWNAEEKVELSNCFSYALNCPDLQWAYSSFFNVLDLNQQRFDEAVRTDTLHNIYKSFACDLYNGKKTSGVWHKVYGLRAYFAGLVSLSHEQVICSDPSNDHIIAINHYMGHYFRLDSNGTWSHKSGVTSAKDTDILGNKITDLEEAVFCFSRDNISLKRLTFKEGDKAKTRYYRIPESGIMVISKPSTRNKLNNRKLVAA